MPKEEVINIDDAPPVDEDVVDDDAKKEVVDDLKTEDGDEDEPSEVKEGEETEDESDDDEYAEDDKEWLAQFEGMPDGIESVEQLAEAHTASLKEMNAKQRDAAKYATVEAAAKAKGFDSVDAFLAGNVAAQGPTAPAARAGTQEGESYFTPNPAGALVESMEKEGVIPKESAGSYNSVARLVDKAYTPQFQKAEQVMEHAMQQMVVLTETVRKLEWDAVPESVRGSIGREEVDRLMQGNDFKSIDEAIQFIHFKNPDLLKQLAKKAEDKGVEKGRRRLRRRKSIGRGKGQNKGQSRQWDYAKYLNEDGEWNTHKLGAMKGDDSILMLEDYEKENFPKS